MESLVDVFSLHRLREWLLWSGLQFVGCGSYGYKIIKLISLHHQNCFWEGFSFLNRQLSFAFLSCFHLTLYFATIFISLCRKSYLPFFIHLFLAGSLCLTVSVSHLLQLLDLYRTFSPLIFNILFHLLYH